MSWLWAAAALRNLSSSANGGTGGRNSVPHVAPSERAALTASRSALAIGSSAGGGDGGLGGEGGPGSGGGPAGGGVAGGSGSRGPEGGGGRTGSAGVGSGGTGSEGPVTGAGGDAPSPSASVRLQAASKHAMARAASTRRNAIGKGNR